MTISKILLAFFALCFFSSFEAHSALRLNSHGKNPNFILESDPSAMVTSMSFIFKTGSASDPKGKEGLTAMAFESLIRGTKSKSQTDFTATMERLGASIQVDTSTMYSILSIDVVSENFEPALKLLAEAILQPGLRDEDLRALREETLAMLSEAQTNNKELGKRVLQMAMYQGTPVSLPRSGTPKSVKTLLPEDVKNFLSNVRTSGNLIVAITSNLPAAKVKKSIETEFVSLPNGIFQSPQIKIPNPIGRTVYLVERKGSSTSEVFIGHPGIPSDYTEKEAVNTGLFIFGADFTSRLMAVLRQDNGWTYGASSSFRLIEKPRRYGGTFVIYTFPQAEFTEKATLKAIELYEDYVKAGVTPKELDYAKNSLANSYAFSFATSKARLLKKVSFLLDGDPAHPVEEYKKLVHKLTTEKVLSIVKAVHDPKNLIVVIVGDPEKIHSTAKAIPNVSSIKVVQDPINSL